MTAPAATSDAVRTSELRRFGGGCVGFSAAARHARLVAAMAQTMPCWGMRMVVVVNCCQRSVILIEVRTRALLKAPGEPFARGLLLLPEMRRGCYRRQIL